MIMIYGPGKEIGVFMQLGVHGLVHMMATELVILTFRIEGVLGMFLEVHLLPHLRLKPRNWIWVSLIIGLG